MRSEVIAGPYGSGVPFQGPQKQIRRFFGDNSRTTEDSSTSKILQESFLRDLSNASNKDVRLHLKFLINSRCFFLLISDKFLVIFKKNSSRLHFSFLEAVFWLRLLARIIGNHQCQIKSLTIILGAEKFGSKNPFSENLKKNDFPILR